MRFLIFLIFLLGGIGCNIAKTPQAHCGKKVSLKSSDYSDIKASVVYNNKCKIYKVSVTTRLDSRSGNIESVSNLNNLTVKLGVFKDTIVNRKIDPNNIQFSSDDNILNFDISFDLPFLDTLDVIYLTMLNRTSDGKRFISKPYFYNETAKILDVDSTYLDYKMFKNSNVVTKALSFKGGKIEKLRITVKVKQIIEEITDIRISLNNLYELNFKSSIVASNNESLLVSNDCILENMLKVDPKFLQLDLDVENKNISKISDIHLELNDNIY